MPTALLTTACCLLLGSLCWAVETSPFPGNKSAWLGFDQYEFTVAAQAYLVVAPAQVAPGRPWIWRAEFFGHEPQADVALLAQGWHVVFNAGAAGHYGSPHGVAVWNACYAYLTGTHGLNAKPALEGFSRGGLLVYHWAAENPDKVCCIYADAPVLDFTSWPGGKGAGKGSADDWKRCLADYGLSEADALAYRQQPIDRLAPLAKAKVPLLHVCGDADEVVPLRENTRVLEERYRALGGEIQVIVKPGVGHHPHSLKDPAPIVAFVLKHAP